MDADLVVYDQITDKVHHLNRTTAAIWRLCDGTSDPQAIRTLASEAVGVDLPIEAVTEAIALLDQANLLDADGMSTRDPGLSRRQMLVRMGLVAAAIPALTTILAPTPAAAATCVNQACRLNGTINRCPGELSTGAGNCRCNATTGNGQCVPCVTSGGTATLDRLCCSNARVPTTTTCT